MTKLWREKDAELQEAHAKLAEAQEKETALRKMILDKAGTQRVSDEEVKVSFVAIRQKLQAIARSSAFDVEQRPRITGYYDRKLVDFYEEWESLTAKDRKSRLRAKIFGLLQEFILEQRDFGLSGYTTFVSVGNGLGRYEPMDAGLVHLEKCFEGQKGERTRQKNYQNAIS